MVLYNLSQNIGHTAEWIFTQIFFIHIYLYIIYMLSIFYLYIIYIHVIITVVITFYTGLMFTCMC